MTEDGADGNSIGVRGRHMLSLYTMNPGEGDSGRLCHAGPHKAPEFPRGLVSTERRGISASDPTPFITHYSLLTPPSSKYGGLSGPHRYNFYCNCTSWSFCLVTVSTTFLFSPHLHLSLPVSSWQKVVTDAKTVKTDAVLHSALFLLTESRAGWSFLA